jgi:hypothetical protein
MEKEDLPSEEDLLSPERTKWMIISISYNHIVLPFANGVELLKNLKDAREISNFNDYGTNTNTKIKALPSGFIKSYILSEEEFLRYRTNALLLD